MLALNEIQCILLILILNFLCLCKGYKNHSLADPDLCSEITKRTIKIETHSRSGLLINEGTLRYHSIVWEHSMLCKFKVKPEGLSLPYYNRDIGIYAVILAMNLRVNNTSCLDYIQFKRKNGTTSTKYCGNLKAAHVLNPARLIGEESINEKMVGFKDPEGELSVYIYIDKSPLNIYEETSLNIVFTAYTKCTSSGGLIPCSKKNNECIDKEYQNDNIINCPYMGCVDEDECRAPELPNSNFGVHTIGGQVLIGSMTSLFVSFLVFVCCLYTCRKYGKLCWSEDFSRPRNNVNRPVAVAQRPQNIEVTLEEAVPTVTESSADKDLPPSYESLFPQNSAANNAR